MPGASQFYQAVTQRRLLEMLEADLGPAIFGALCDPEVTEISANSDGSVWVERIGAARSRIPDTMRPDRAWSVLAAVATAKGETIGEANPSFDAIIPGHGYRFVGTLPPLTAAPAFTIRKKPDRVITLDEY